MSNICKLVLAGLITRAPNGLEKFVILYLILNHSNGPIFVINSAFRIIQNHNNLPPELI